MFTGFSISNYKMALNVSTMTVYQVSELLEKLGIAEFMNPIPCDRNTAHFNYTHEWVNGRHFITKKKINRFPHFLASVSN